MNNFWDPDLYSKAWDFATHAHEGQSYGGRSEGMRVPYINHIGSVAMEVSWALSQSAEVYDANFALQCALLHDVIEDTHYGYQDVSNEFGEQVADGVAALSKNEALPTKSEQMADSIQRIKLQPKEVWMVKLADRITNLYHPPFYWPAERILEYCEEAKCIHDELGPGNPALALRLDRKIREYPAFAERLGEARAHSEGRQKPASE